MNKVLGILTVVMVIVVGALTISTVYAAHSGFSVVASHIGATDPTTEGWTKSTRHGHNQTGPVIGDPDATTGGTRDAWRLEDSSGGAGGDETSYNRNLTSAQSQEAFANGWVYEGLIRVVQGSSSPISNTTVDMAIWGLNGHRYMMHLGKSGNSPVVGLRTANGQTGHTIPLTNLGPGYHRYEMRSQPGSNNVDVYVDNQLVFSNWTGYNHGSNSTQLQWGSNGALYSGGDGHYAEIKFSIGEDQDTPQCSDHEDNDGDGKVDADDPGCSGPEDDDESDEPADKPECSDNKDNDGDGVEDADDPGCHTDGDPNDGDDTYNPKDDSEKNGQCSDGVDNEGDGLVDKQDPECHTDGNPKNDKSYDGNRDEDTDNRKVPVVKGVAAVHVQPQAPVSVPVTARTGAGATTAVVMTMLGAAGLGVRKFIS